MERTFLNALRNGHLEVVRDDYAVRQASRNDVRANRDHAVRASSINGHLDVVKSENFIERTI